eukprot:3656932-Rhodomonas_salina.4
MEPYARSVADIAWQHMVCQYRAWRSSMCQVSTGHGVAAYARSEADIACRRVERYRTSCMAGEKGGRREEGGVPEMD